MTPDLPPDPNITLLPIEAGVCAVLVIIALVALYAWSSGAAWLCRSSVASSFFIQTMRVVINHMQGKCDLPAHLVKIEGRCEGIPPKGYGADACGLFKAL